jgi:hypothetical protein
LGMVDKCATGGGKWCEGAMWPERCNVAGD